MKSDIEIAQEIKLRDIADVASEIGIKEENLESYGKHMAKVVTPKVQRINTKNNKLVLVTAIHQQKAGIGKTTVSDWIGARTE